MTQPIDGYVLKEIPHRNERVDFIPGSFFDYGGIVEPVELVMTPAVRVDDIYLRPDWKTGDIRVQVRLRNAAAKATKGHVQLAVSPAATGKTLLVKHLAHAMPTGDTQVECDSARGKSSAVGFERSISISGDGAGERGWGGRRRRSFGALRLSRLSRGEGILPA